MEPVVIIPKRNSTFVICIEALQQSPERRLFQSELKRLVSPRSWRLVVRKELNQWNESINEEYPGISLTINNQETNPRSGRNDEVLVQLHPQIEIAFKQKHIAVLIRGDSA